MPKTARIRGIKGFPAFRLKIICRDNGQFYYSLLPSSLSSPRRACLNERSPLPTSPAILPIRPTPNKRITSASISISSVVPICGKENLLSRSPVKFRSAGYTNINQCLNYICYYMEFQRLICWNRLEYICPAFNPATLFIYLSQLF